jgi:Ca2+-binding EF-hand superfamily protein
MIAYFDLDGDGKLNYHDFLQIVLPCDDSFLRAAATQRPNSDIPKCEFLSARIERALSQLLFKEVRYHLKADQMKRTLENAYDFTGKKAFAAIDDWNYGYLDQNNIKRFLRGAGHVATKGELVGILRRFDVDGDQKINLKEFELGIKSTLTVFTSNPKPCRP